MTFDITKIYQGQDSFGVTSQFRVDPSKGFTCGPVRYEVVQVSRDGGDTWTDYAADTASQTRAFLMTLKVL